MVVHYNALIFFQEDGTPAYLTKGHASAEDFREFGKRIGVQPKRIDKLLAPFLIKQEQVESLISRSFLNEPAKRAYLMHYQNKRNFLMG